MKRCAIYTRKSTEEGLDMAFNSLDAQREACAAFIVSQRHEGWTAVKKTYDDGGFSGGSMERPGLQQLLADIRNGFVDIVVVYKIDRLTRSLADFAKMVDVFDARGVSFVSVTQQFNTTTSMGRLTLNVLLSFAQFEREVTAERIRDKIAASKKKGLWMGGSPPLGYDIRDKKLAVNRDEAGQVRRLFEAYLELRSTKALTSWAAEQGITTKKRFSADGRMRSGGRPFTRGNLHALLRYRTYVGEVAHKDAVYAGDHEAILSRELWNKVQDGLNSGRRDKGGRTGNPQSGAPPSLPLTGLVFDETGDRLTPVHATKKDRRYYYYISSRLNEADVPDAAAWRLAAPVLEQAVMVAMRDFLQDDHQVLEVLQSHAVDRMAPAHILDQLLRNLKELIERIRQSQPREAVQLMVTAIGRIDLGPDQMTIRINISALHNLLDSRSLAAAITTSSETTHALVAPLIMKRRGVETRLIIGEANASRSAGDPVLIGTIARARAWFEDLKSGTAASINDIAARANLPASEVSRQLPLAFLAPGIVKAILDGQQPVDLTAKTLQRLPGLPLDWNEQARLLGFKNL